MLEQRILNTELKDDKSDYGGIAYLGETVEDFIESVGIAPSNINELNDALKECGIEPIKERG